MATICIKLVFFLRLPGGAELPAGLREVGALRHALRGQLQAEGGGAWGGGLGGGLGGRGCWAPWARFLLGELVLL